MMEEQELEVVQAEIKKELMEVLISKKEELHMLGYDAVTADEVWDCVISKYKKGWPPKFQIVNDIYSLRPTAFMNWLTIHSIYLDN